VRHRIVVAVVAALAGALVGGAPLDAQSVRLGLSRSEITVQEHVLVAVTVEGAIGARPTLPTPPAFEVRFQGEETQIAMVNGRLSRQKTFTWALFPRETGTFAIGPAEVELDGQMQRSAPAELRVLSASSQPRGARPVFLAASVSNPNPFVGEQVIYVWRFYRRARVADPRLESLDFGSFLVEDLGDVRYYTASEGGVEYEVSELRKALFAQRPGTFVIPPSRLQVQLVHTTRRGVTDPTDGFRSPFDEFFGQFRAEPHLLSTEPIEITVRPLPPAPVGFSGLVGEFAVQSTASDTEVAVGESVTQKVVVNGSGNLHLMGDLPLDELEGFKVYRDQPTLAIERGGGRLRGTKTFTRALVPLAAGERALPEMRLVYFDPARESYVTATAPAIALDVVPGAGDEELRLTESMAGGSAKVAVRILGDDLLPIHPGLEIVEASPLTAALPVLLVAPPLAFLALLLVRRRADRLAGDQGLRRRRGALRRATKAIGAAGPTLAPREASAVLRRYVGDRVGAEGGALTPRECADRLEALGASPALVQETRELLGRLEAADFGGGGTSSIAAGELRGLLDRLDRELKRERS
jgi:hypothetical protein